jgi:hypothetical protein
MNEDIKEAQKILDPLIDKFLEQAGEHADSVQVFITVPNGTGTIRMNRGNGNWFASFGLISSWLEEHKGIYREIGADDARKRKDGHE